MVSLFSTSTSSSATRNDARRAAYALEAGVRYAFSEMRNEDFATDTIGKLNSTTAYTLDSGQNFNIGGGSSTSNEFGGVWYNEDKSIGGNNNFCQAGECEFGLGARAFFTLDYAGDGEGLEPPKIAMEFDTRTDSGNFQYCNPVASTDPADSQQNSRNDPLSTDRDAVQYVFWGFDPTLAIPCRDDKPSYDDNRHDSGEGQHHWGKSGLGIPIRRGSREEDFLVEAAFSREKEHGPIVYRG